MQWLWLVYTAAAGIFAHHGFFIRGEWHLAGPKVILGHIVLASVSWWYFLRHQPGTISEHIHISSLAFSSYLISLFSSIVVYRLFFHPLRRFPGPKLAAITKFWHISKSWGGNNFRVLEEARHQYGQFVRTGKHFPRGRGFTLMPEWSK